MIRRDLQAVQRETSAPSVPPAWWRQRAGWQRNHRGLARPVLPARSPEAPDELAAVAGVLPLPLLLPPLLLHCHQQDLQRSCLLLAQTRLALLPLAAPLPLSTLLPPLLLLLHCHQ